MSSNNGPAGWPSSRPESPRSNGSRRSSLAARDEIGQLGEEILDLRDHSTRSEAAASEATREAEDLRTQLDQLRSEREALRDEVARLGSEVKGGEAAHAGLAAERDEHSREAVRLRSEVEALGRSLAEADEARRAGEARIDALRAEWEARLAEGEHAVEAIVLERDDARSRADDDLANAARRHEAEVAGLAAQLDEARAREAVLTGRVDARFDRGRGAGACAGRGAGGPSGWRGPDRSPPSRIGGARLVERERAVEAMSLERDEARRIAADELRDASRRHETEIAGLAAELNEARAHEAALADRVNALSTELEARLRDREQTAGALAQERDKALDRAERAEAERAVLAGRLDEADAEVEVLTTRVAALETEAAEQARLRQAAEADRDEATRLAAEAQVEASKRAAERDDALAAGEALAARVEGLSAESEALVRARDDVVAELAEARRKAKAEWAAATSRHEAEAARLSPPARRHPPGAGWPGRPARPGRGSGRGPSRRSGRPRPGSRRVGCTLPAEADVLARRLRRLRSRARRAIGIWRRRLDESARQYEQALGSVRAEVERARLDVAALRTERDTPCGVSARPRSGRP